MVSDTTLDVVVRALARQFGLDPAHLDVDLPVTEQPGMESVLLLRAVVEIEEICDVAIPDDVLFEVSTIREFTNLIIELGGRP
jgi:acyl carrier protein